MEKPAQPPSVVYASFIISLLIELPFQICQMHQGTILCKKPGGPVSVTPWRIYQYLSFLSTKRIPWKSNWATKHHHKLFLTVRGVWVHLSKVPFVILWANLSTLEMLLEGLKGNPLCLSIYGAEYFGANHFISYNLRQEPSVIGCWVGIVC